MLKKRKRQHILRKMKLLVFFTLIGFCTCRAEMLAQNSRITLHVTDTKLKEVLQQIEELTDYMFVYKLEDIESVGRVTLQEKDTEVSRILEKCLEKTGLSYLFRDNLIVIRKNIPQQQLRQLSGKVTDAKGQTLPGVSVIIKGTSQGVVTNSKGEFILPLPESQEIKLMFSFIGMETQEITYTGQKEINVVMQESLTEFDEVVITGYQVIDRRKLTSAVASKKMDDIMVQGAMSLDQMLEGQVPDMVVMTNSGEVGVVPKIRIRGTSTLVGNREPLWVVDGIIVQDPVPISAEELNDPDYINRIGNAIAGLNPQDIERLDILKDAAATALYGTKAANGVIVVTTKKGRVGPPVINYNMTTTLRQRPRYTDRAINLMDSKERIQFSRELYDQHYDFNNNSMNLVGYEGLLVDLYNGVINENRFAEEVAKLETTNTDWFKLLTEDTFSHQHTISVSGGSETTRYYSSIGFSRDNDVIKGNYYQRYTAALNLETTLYEWLKASFQMQGNVSRRKYNQSEISPMNYAYNTSRAIPAYDEAGEYFYYNKTMSTSNLRRKYNILNELDNSFDDQHSSGITVNVNLLFRFTDWLNANAIISYSNSNAEIEGYWGEKTFHVASLRGSDFGVLPPSYSSLPFGGELSRKETRSNSYTIRLQGNANKYFGMDEQHNINASAGFEMSSSRSNGFSSVDRGYYLDRGKKFVSNINVTDYPDYGEWLTRNVPGISDNLTNMLSGYGTVSYSYQNYFTVNANARIDGSNKFGDQSNDKFLPIWSFSGAYNFSEHEALKANWIDYMTLKLSYGYQGNMLEDQSPVMLIEKLPLDPYYNENKSQISRNPNPNLKWEKTSSFNAGLMFSLLKRNIQVEAQYYYKRTKDAFMTKEVASMNGVSDYVINGGDVENQGYSVDLTVLPFKRENFHWTVSTSFSKNYNKVKNDPSSQNYGYQEFLNGTAIVKDKAVNSFYSYEFMGLSPVDGGPLFNDMENQKHQLFGLSKYETFTRVLKPSGRREPYMSGGLSTNLRYKNIRMSAMFAYSLGAKTRLFRMFNKEVEPEFNVHCDLMKRWRQPGDENQTNIPALVANNSDAYWKYKSRHYSDMFDNLQVFAMDYYTMYDFSDARVVSANYLKCSNLSFTYEFGEQMLSRMSLSRLALSLSGTNLFTLCSSKLKGQTPTQGGFSEIQLSERPTYTLGLSVSF